MDRTGQCRLVAVWIVLLLASSVAPVVAAPGGGPAATLSEAPAAFAERVTAGREPSGRGSIQEAIELIVLASVCAIGVAFYLSVSAHREETKVSTRTRRR